MKKHFKKNLAYSMLSLILSVFFCTSSYALSMNEMHGTEAPEVPKYLLVWDKNGGTVAFPLDERPCITVDVENSTINCVTKKEEVKFSLKDVHKYTLEATSGEDTAIGELQKVEGEFNNNNNAFIFNNYKPGTPINIYTMNGMLVATYKINGDGSLWVSVDNWDNGIYLIKVGSVTYKIIKK